MATSGFKLVIFKDIFPNRSINSRRDFPFSYHILLNAREVRWCGLLVANWMPKRVTNVSKQSIELGGNHVKYKTLLGWWKRRRAPPVSSAIVLAHSQPLPTCKKFHLHDPIPEGVASGCSRSRACLVGGGLYPGLGSPCVVLSFFITMRFFPLLGILLNLPSHPLVLLS